MANHLIVVTSLITLFIVISTRCDVMRDVGRCGGEGRMQAGKHKQTHRQTDRQTTTSKSLGYFPEPPNNFFTTQEYVTRLSFSPYWAAGLQMLSYPLCKPS